MVELTKSITPLFIVLSRKKGKKYIVGDTGAGYAGKMLSMAAKKFGLKCKIFGTKILKGKDLTLRQ